MRDSRTVGIIAKFLLVGFLVLDFNAFAVEVPQEWDRGEEHGLFAYTATDSLASDATEPLAAEGGALSMVRDFGVLWYPGLGTCTQSLHSLAIEWGREYQLILISEEYADEGFTIEFWNSDQTGIFRLRYESTHGANELVTRISLTYFTHTNVSFPVSDRLDLVERYRTDLLADSFRGAIACYDS